MNFPDKPHFLKIQEALWQWPKSKVSLMVGAGFSLNAKRNEGAKIGFKTWDALVWKMYEEIFPKDESWSKDDKYAWERKFNTLNPLKIASLYESYFDRNKLNQLIKEQNPDDDHRPSELHEILLKLPWTDVFTTNYDRLLERTVITERSYQPVIKTSELTHSKQPRIIKLHGSFPSQTPFVITEEDYRAYPKTNAPFVNTVQQSLIESSLVLIGFSGDDPNFLQWIGWIRDNFGEKEHCPIYLICPTGVSQVEKGLLTKRGVTTIELDCLFKGSKFETNIHANALKWFFLSLSASKPKREDSWLESEHSQNQQIEDDFPELCTPYKEKIPARRLGLSSGSLSNEEVIELLQRWRFERSTYPGWIIAPLDKRKSIWEYTKRFENLLIQDIADKELSERISILYEITWRYEIALIPLSSELTDYIADTLKRISEKEPCSIFNGLTFEIGLTLLQEYREDANFKYWDSIYILLSSNASNDESIQNRLKYELILKYLIHFDYKRAIESVQNWNPTTHDVTAVIRKAGILIELGEKNQARPLLEESLTEIRASQHKQKANINLYSKEGWCMFLLLLTEELESFYQSREKYNERWRELKQWSCDPWETKTYFDTVLTHDTPVVKKQGYITKKGFDVGVVKSSQRWSDETIEPWLPAIGFIRMFEKVGIPMFTSSFNTRGKGFKYACNWIGELNFKYSVYLLIRSGEYENIDEIKHFSRLNLAILDESIIFETNQCVLESLKNLIESGGKNVNKLKALVEVASRLTMRLSDDELERTFVEALKFNYHPLVKESHKLRESPKIWFKRLFDRASNKQLCSWMPSLLDADLIGDNIATSSLESHWLDPMFYFSSCCLHANENCTKEIKREINSKTNTLLHLVRAKNGETRKRILDRVHKVFTAGLMSKKQKEQYGSELWRDVPIGELPNTSFYTYSYESLPSPKDRNVKELVRKYIHNLRPENTVSKNDKGHISYSLGLNADTMISELSLATRPLIRTPNDSAGLIKWSSQECQIFLGQIIKWWNNEKVIFERDSESFTSFNSESFRSSLDRLDVFLANAVNPISKDFPENEAEKLKSFTKELSSCRAGVLIHLPYQLIDNRCLVNEITDELLENFNSDSSRLISRASKAIFHWVALAQKGIIQEPPKELLKTILNAIIFRRYDAVKPCIHQVILLLQKYPDSVDQVYHEMLCESLISWHNVLQLPDNSNTIGEYPLDERPEMRAKIVSLANALLQWGQDKDCDEHEGITLWKNISQYDPFPEVQNAWTL